MPNDTSSAATAVAVESPDGAAVSVGRERRVTEQLISDWQEETRRLGHALAFMTLNTSAMTGPLPGQFCRPTDTLSPARQIYSYLRRTIGGKDRSIPAVIQPCRTVKICIETGGVLQVNLSTAVIITYMSLSSPAPVKNLNDNIPCIFSRINANV